MSDPAAEEVFKAQDRPAEPCSSTVVKITNIQPMDIMCGRGGAANKHNSHFRLVVDQYKPEYLKAKKNEKREIAKRIVSDISSKGGRFLRKVEEDSGGYWVQLDTTKAIEKTLQALREGLEVRKSGSDGAPYKPSARSNHNAVQNVPQDVTAATTTSSADVAQPAPCSTPSASPRSKRLKQQDCDDNNSSSNMFMYPSPLPYSHHPPQMHSIPPPHQYGGYPIYPRGPYYSPYHPPPYHGQYPPPPYPYIVYGPPPQHHAQPPINPDMSPMPPTYNNFSNQTTANSGNPDNSIIDAANSGGSKNNDNIDGDKKVPKTTKGKQQKVTAPKNLPPESLETPKTRDLIPSNGNSNSGGMQPNSGASSSEPLLTNSAATAIKTESSKQLQVTTEKQPEIEKATKLTVPL